MSVSATCWYFGDWQVHGMTRKQGLKDPTANNQHELSSQPPNPISTSSSCDHYVPNHTQKQMRRRCLIYPCSHGLVLCSVAFSRRFLKGGFQKGGFGGCTPVPTFYFLFFFLVLSTFWQFGAVSLPKGGRPRPSVLPELRFAVH